MGASAAADTAPVLIEGDIVLAPRTQCRRFSIDQWRRFNSSRRSGEASLELRLVTPWTVSRVNLPLPHSVRSRSIVKTWAAWGKSR